MIEADRVPAAADAIDARVQALWLAHDGYARDRDHPDPLRRMRAVQRQAQTRRQIDRLMLLRSWCD